MSGRTASISPGCACPPATTLEPLLAPAICLVSMRKDAFGSYWPPSSAGLPHFPIGCNYWCARGQAQAVSWPLHLVSLGERGDAGSRYCGWMDS